VRTADEPILRARDLTKVYRRGASEVRAVDGIDLDVASGELMAIMGRSGSGKTTLLDLLGCLLRPTSGELEIDGVSVIGASDGELATIRRERIGFVFQEFNLIPTLTAVENVLLPLRYGPRRPDGKRRAAELLDLVGLTERGTHRPTELSGGEQQRVAIARSLVNDPAVILADEPTGELDSSSAATIFELFHSLNRTFGLTVVIVSHDANVAHYVERVVAIRDGKTSSETMRKLRDQGDGAAESGAEGHDDPATHVFEELMMLDSAGRLQVPKEVRERYGIGDRVHMEETADGLLLRPVVGAEAPVRRLAPADEPPARKVGRLGRLVNRVRGRG